MYTLLTEVKTNDGDMRIEVYTITYETLSRLQGIIKALDNAEIEYLPRIEDYDNSEMEDVCNGVISKEDFDLFTAYIPVPDPGYATLGSMSFFLGEKISMGRW